MSVVSWRKIGLFVSLVFCALLGPSVGHASSFSTNFESDPPFYTSGTASFSWATDLSHSPSHALKIVSNQSALTRWMSNISLVPVTAGETLNASAYLKAQGVSGGYAGVTLTFWTSAQTYVSGSAVDSAQTVSGTTDWTQIFVGATAPTGAAFVRIEFRLFGPGTLWIDDASVLGSFFGQIGNLSKPSLLGDTFVGGTLTINLGTWNQFFDHSTGALLRCDSNGMNCETIFGSFGSPGHFGGSYVLTAADLGKTLRVRVAVYNDGAGSDGVLSDPTPVIADASRCNLTGSVCMLAPDADIEADPRAFYYTAGGAVFTWASDASHSPTHALKIVSTQPSGVLSRWMTVVRAIRVVEDPIVFYKVSAYLKTQDASQAVLAVTFWDANGNYIPGSAMNAPLTLHGTQDWTLVGLAPAPGGTSPGYFHPPAGAAFMRVEFRLYGPGTLWVDDLFVLQDVFPP